MCDYTRVEYACGHLRYTVRAWCNKYSETHKRCPANVVAVDYRYGENCGDCKNTPSTHSRGTQAVKEDESAESTSTGTSEANTDV